VDGVLVGAGSHNSSIKTQKASETFQLLAMAPNIKQNPDTQKNQVNGPLG